MELRKARQTIRCGDVAFYLEATFESSDEPEPITEAWSFIIAKPFYRPYLLLLAFLQDIGNNELAIVHQADEGGSFSFWTSREICTDMLLRHERSLVSARLKLLNYTQSQLNCLRLADDRDFVQVPPVRISQQHSTCMLHPFYTWVMRRVAYCLAGKLCSAILQHAACNIFV